MRPIVVTKTLTAASVNNIAQTQTLAGAGNLTINGSAASGGVATLDTARRVLITSAGNDSGITFTVIGTNTFGNLFKETVTGGNIAAVATKSDFLTVTKITASGATAAGVQVGTNTVGSGPWISVSQHIPTVELATTVEVTGTVNYTVEYTYQDVNFLPTNNAYGAYQNDFVVPTTWPDQVLTGLTANGSNVINDPVMFARVTVNSGTGTAKATFLQAGIAGPGR